MTTEQNGRDSIADLRESAGRGGKVRFEFHLILDAQKLTLLFKN